jgi:ribosomal protein S18 acetylase RimI-like enzyme
MTTLPVTTRIQGHLRASLGPDAPRVGPFRLCYAPDTDNVFRNYAVPDADAQPGPPDVADLLDWFASHARRPRLEYVAPAAALESALLAAGFTVERQLPLMVLTELTAPAVPAGAVLRLVTGDAELADCARVQNTAYGESPEPTPADLDRLRRLVAGGGAAALATVDGEPASAGISTVPRDGLAEVAGVGTLPGFRRRGLAGSVVVELCRAALAAGVTPYLQAESEREAALYARLGFTRVGTLTLVNGPA